MGAPHCIHYLLICIDLWSLEFYCFFISIYSKTYCIKRALPFLPTCHHAGSLVQEQQVWLGHLGSRGHCYWWDHLQSHEPTNKLKNKWCYGMEHSYTFFFTYLYKFEFDDHEPQHKECPRKWLLTPCSQSVRDSSSLRLSNAQCILLVEYYPGWYCHVLSKSRSMDSIIRTCNRNPTFKPVEEGVIDLVPFSVHSALNTDIAGMTTTVHNG